MSIQEYQPFHEILSDSIRSLSLLIGVGGVTHETEIELVTVLNFARAQMPAAEAHKIAVENENLPEIIRAAGKPVLADHVAGVLNGLRYREDEKFPRLVRVLSNVG